MTDRVTATGMDLEKHDIEQRKDIQQPVPGMDLDHIELGAGTEHWWDELEQPDEEEDDLWWLDDSQVMWEEKGTARESSQAEYERIARKKKDERYYADLDELVNLDWAEKEERCPQAINHQWEVDFPTDAELGSVLCRQSRKQNSKQGKFLREGAKTYVGNFFNY